jgi:hypothetical protein
MGVGVGVGVGIGNYFLNRILIPQEIQARIEKWD